MSKKIVYPLFLELSKRCKDNYWKELFRNCAQGILPRNCAVNDTELVVWINKGKKNIPKKFDLKTETDKYDSLLLEIKQCLQTDLNIWSEKEKAFQEDKLFSWFKEKSEIDSNIGVIVQNITNKYKLNKVQCLHLFSLLLIQEYQGSFKNLNSKNIYDKIQINSNGYFTYKK